jgi:DNA-binding MarR family transcriptional regulator
MPRDTTRAQISEIRRGVTRLASRLRSERPFGALSGNKTSVLSYLYRQGPATPTVLALAEHQQPQSLTRVYAELELAGLILRRQDPVDRRQSILAITEAGVAALSADMASRDHWLASALEEVSDTERQVLLLAASIMNRLTELPAAPSGATERRVG